MAPPAPEIPVQPRRRVRVAPWPAMLVVVVVAAVWVRGQTPTAANLGDRIPFEGLAANNTGLAFWNAGPDAGEPETLGHPTPCPPLLGDRAVLRRDARLQ